MGRQGVDQKFRATHGPIFSILRVWQRFGKCLSDLNAVAYTRAMIYSPKPWNARSMISCLAERANGWLWSETMGKFEISLPLPKQAAHNSTVQHFRGHMLAIQKVSHPPPNLSAIFSRLF